MFSKKIVVLAAGLVALGLTTTVANADDITVKFGPSHEHHHDHRCHRVVYERVCHGSYHYQRCHMERREFWRC